MEEESMSIEERRQSVTDKVNQLSERGNYPTIFVTNVGQIDNLYAWRQFIPEATEAQLRSAQRALNDLIDQAKKQERRDREHEAVNPVIDPDAPETLVERLNRERAEEATARARFRETDSGRLERAVELLERIAEQLDKR